ncbi:MAG: acyl-CoA thioesterase, partial [Bacteroidales bacterium]|nr:acyl-CoA thioesterase [Bacteroidales bacterium]
MHSIPIQIRFNDIDQMGHVNNTIIMEYFDLGKSRYFHDAGIPVIPEEGDFCVMIVHLELDFKSQIHFHDDP